MPITQSAKKALRGSERKRVVNVRRKKKVDIAVKGVKSLTATDKATAQTALSKAYKELDKAAKSGLIKKGAADRKKSRLSKMVKKLG
jgi:small subunit ribosomal protein S20